eukprot:TRINITY_DN17005_c0_g1_i2.p1 TRINITY_DN17005_c0_g1~~TRINITY_DN17005_c0_g1_i2.p1  ORF type:complete len:327 (-),score=28.09 TRINITY_DN17005_c0_g1_i2:12-992(-)
MGAFITGIAPVPSREAGGRCRDEGSIAVQIEAVGVTGGTLASVVLDSLTCLRDLKAAIEEAGGPPSRRQELIINGDVQDNLARTLADFLQPLGTNASGVVDNTAGNDSTADNVDVTQHTNASLEVTVIIVPADENLALISMGASFDGHASLNSKPLLNHDVAFPELREVPWWEEDDVEMAVPASKRQGLIFHRHLLQSSQNWRSDLAQTFILGHNNSRFTIQLGGGAKLAKVGFTYSPWVGKSGRLCIVYGVRRSGDRVIVEVGRINIPNSQIDRGNPSHHTVQTLMCNTNHHSDIFDAVRFDFLGPSVGRRLYFVYCIGRLVDDD